jgi:histidinol-phosphate aminotransferase
MKKPFKSHISNLDRYQTSLGRDLVSGLRLDRNERVDDLPQEIIDDIFSKLSPHCFAASPEAGSLYEAIAQTLELNTGQIFVTSGITEGIRVLYDCCCQPRDNVVCLHPTYPMYEIYAGMYNVQYRKLTYNVDTRLPDLESLKRNLDEKTRFLFIPNPNLPIESCFSILQLEELANQCKKTNTFLIIDEAYHYFGAPSSLELITRHENVVVFRTFSKAFGLAGLRLGFMLSDEENIDYFSKSRSIVESNTLSMTVAEYMLRNPQIMLDHVRSVKDGSAYIKGKLNELGLSWWGGDLTNGMMIFLDSHHCAKDLVNEMRKRKIFIRGGFEPPFDNCVRISLGKASKMKIFSDAIKEWVTSASG